VGRRVRASRSNGISGEAIKALSTGCYWPDPWRHSVSRAFWRATSSPRCICSQWDRGLGPDPFPPCGDDHCSRSVSVRLDSPLFSPVDPNAAVQCPTRSTQRGSLRYLLRPAPLPFQIRQGTANQCGLRHSHVGGSGSCRAAADQAPVASPRAKPPWGRVRTDTKARFADSS